VTTPPNGQRACREAEERKARPLPDSARVWLIEIRAIRIKKKAGPRGGSGFG